jgi:hypothetical protein
MNSILTVTTPASSYDLTALATVKTELGIADNTENDKLRTWITQASIIAASYCRRVFARETLTETFRPARNCSSHGEFLILQRRPIASITSVTVDDVAVDAAEYETDANPGLLYRLDSSGYRSCWYSAKSIIVVYLAGYILLDTLAAGHRARRDHDGEGHAVGQRPGARSDSGGHPRRDQPPLVVRRRGDASAAA